jgi:hypothetical protein
MIGDIISELRYRVDRAIENGDDKYTANWNDQEGIVICVSDAMEILEALERIQVVKYD